MTQQQLYTIRIGKQGITTTIIDEIKRQLKQHNRVKVKFLLTATKDKKKIAQEIADLAVAKVIQRIGFTVVLQKLSSQ